MESRHKPFACFIQGKTTSETMKSGQLSIPFDTLSVLSISLGHECDAMDDAVGRQPSIFVEIVTSRMTILENYQLIIFIYLILSSQTIKIYALVDPTQYGQAQNNILKLGQNSHHRQKPKKKSTGYNNICMMYMAPYCH